ncbi:MAG TPA: triose-phosphate isomerase, partial [Verrucomicrobiales bacterium]|nr:triose-phosphate isomerase [Verrucomicrobiales bacterium]
MARKLIIAANWKMNKGPAETAGFIEAFLPSAQALAGECDIVIAPPFISIPSASALLADSPVALSAQN